jgi:hypothetical protein
MITITKKQRLYTGFLSIAGLLAIGALVFTSLVTTQEQKVSAAVASNWEAGRIIDDGLFYNGSDMSVAEIQSFLNGRVTNCDTNGTQKYNSSMTNAQYAASQGWAAPPYVCLKDYFQVPRGDQNINNLSTNVVPSGAISAAAIIKSAAATYNVNPKALLVLLEKESLNLMKDSWPLPKQYRNPMGYGCPDTAPCDPQYEGFYNQMMNAARQFKIYKDNAGSYRHKSNQTNDILYQANNPGCGSSGVYVQNQATAGLYNYTPYQPNRAALNNLYGSGDACSAYGNRNFWRIYSDWFGTTNADLFQAKIETQSVYPNLVEGEGKTVSFQFRNNGQWSWHDDSVDWPGMPALHLTTAGAPSSFSYGWPTGTVAAKNFSKVLLGDGITLAPNQHIVESGQIVQFDVPLTAPWGIKTGLYFQDFKLTLNGTSIDLGKDSSARMGINVPANFSASIVNNPSKIELAPGEGKQVTMKVKNDGAWSWHDDKINWPGMPATYLAHVRQNAPSTPVISQFGYGWTNQNIAAKTFNKVYEADGTTLAPDQHTAYKNQIVEFSFTVTAPWSAEVGTYDLNLSPVLNGTAMSYGNDSVGTVKVEIPAWRAAVVSTNTTESVTKGQQKPVSIRYKNTGAWTWHDDAINWPGVPSMHLATANPDNRSSFSYGWVAPEATAAKVFGKVFESDGVTLAGNQHTANPGQIVQYDFTMTTPWAMPSGIFTELFKPVLGSPNTYLGDNTVTRLNIRVP